jgi:hypothetical protein
VLLATFFTVLKLSIVYLVVAVSLKDLGHFNPTVMKMLFWIAPFMMISSFGLSNAVVKRYKLKR